MPMLYNIDLEARDCLVVVNNHLHLGLKVA